MITIPLGSLIERDDIVWSSGSLDNILSLEIPSLVSDSRKVTPGAVFFALKGGKTDGHSFIEDALERGARVIVAEDEAALKLTTLSVPRLVVKNIRQVLALAAVRFFGSPSSRMQAVGITGTNGKTSVAYLLSCALGQLAGSCVLVGTLGIAVIKKAEDFGRLQLEKTLNTTPDPLEIQAALFRGRAEGASALAAEVTSQGLAQKRTFGMQWDAAVFMNLTLDHLDLHGSMEAYAKLKKDLFHIELKESKKRKKTAIINIDDAVGRELAEELERDSEVGLLRFSAEGRDAELKAINTVLAIDRTIVEVVYNGSVGRLVSRLVGRYNVSNLLAYAASLLGLGYSLADASSVLTAIPPVPGRLERVPAKDIHVFIDYAHTPDALINVQESLREIAPGRLVTVFGCGGDRDRGKRPLMGRAVQERAQLAIVTSDNPRTEDPERIITDILPGILEAPPRADFEYKCITNRREAIDFAISTASPGDVILVAGKGHEDYQEVQGVRHPFLDRSVCEEALKTRGRG